jgi:tyrosine-specific transport protein
MSTKHTFLLSLLVVGNLIGAGILAMPIVTGIAGYLPSLVIMAIFASGMFFSAMVLVNEANATKDETFNYPSLYEKHLGFWGKWVASIANIIILHGLLTGYLAGGSQVIVSALGIEHTFTPVVLFLLFAVLSFIAISGMSVIQKYNSFLIISLWMAFAFLVFIAMQSVDDKRLLHVDYSFLPLAVPMIVTGFHFHNIIPSLCKDASWSKDILKPIAIGMIIGFVMNAIWIYVGAGVVPEFGKLSLDTAWLGGLPITVEMSGILDSKIFSIMAMLFAIVAISSSYLANGMGLKDFTNDMLVNTFGIDNRYFLYALSFLPPLFIAYFFADIFLKAIGIAGGVGIVLLFGILPSVIYYKKADTTFKKSVAIFFFLAFGVALIFTLLQTFGVLNIQPSH